MKKIITSGIFATALMLSAGGAQAMESGAYIGTGGGIASIAMDGATGPSIKGRATAMFVKAGYNIFNNLAVEARYGATDKAALSGPGAGSSYLKHFASVLLKPQFQIGPDTNLYALIGVTHISGKMNVPGPANGTFSQMTPSAGIGIEFNMNQIATLGLEAMRVAHQAKITNTPSKVTVDTVSAVFTFRF